MDKLAQQNSKYDGSRETRDRIEKVFAALILLKESFFLGSENRGSGIDLIERSLDISLPESFKAFLLQFGSGGNSSLEIDGIGINEQTNMISQTIENRKMFNSFHTKLVFFSYGEDWDYCLDTSRMEDGECPVVEFDYVNDRIIDVAPGFLDFLVDKFGLEIK